MGVGAWSPFVGARLLHCANSYRHNSNISLHCVLQRPTLCSSTACALEQLHMMSHVLLPLPRVIYVAYNALWPCDENFTYVHSFEVADLFQRLPLLLLGC